MAQISKNQAVKVVEAVLHKISCCEFIPNIERCLTERGSNWVFESPQHEDLGAKERAVIIQVFANGTWEAHNYQHGDNAYGTFSFRGRKLTVSVKDL